MSEGYFNKEELSPFGLKEKREVNSTHDFVAHRMCVAAGSPSKATLLPT